MLLGCPISYKKSKYIKKYNGDIEKSYKFIAIFLLNILKIVN